MSDTASPKSPVSRLACEKRPLLPTLGYNLEMIGETEIKTDATINKHAVLLFSDTSRFPYIPKQLPSYVEACISNGRTNRLVQAVQGERTKVFENINRMFHLACDATGLNPDELLHKTDFNSRDMSPTRLDAAFAEIRTIYFLEEQGFKDIQLLKAGKRKKADILGTLRGNEFAAEVANSIFSANKRVEPFQLSDWLVGRASSDGKTDQLMQTSGDRGDKRTILVGVIDTFFSVVFNTHDDYCEAAKLTWENLDGKEGFHVAFITGKKAVGYMPDDCVFPDWPSN